MKYSINHTAQHFKMAVEAAAIELNWEIDKLDQHEAIAYQRDVPMQSEGIRITILRDDSRIYFNSVIDPFFGSNPLSWGLHRKNLKVFSKNLVSISRGIDIPEEVRQNRALKEYQSDNEDEWSLKNTIKRIVIYLVILVFSFFSLFMHVSTGAILIPVIIFTIFMAYIVMDIHIILKKNKSKQTTKHL